ncbi:hypothetical protein, partial [Actinomyces ruminis]|uniref:hypothetical protein n=1 Tax=Actinomyces ruminis TaxID=1937003 RepID=UPI003B84B2C8
MREDSESSDPVAPDDSAESADAAAALAAPQSPDDAGPRPSTVVGAATDIGRLRRVNEDAISPSRPPLSWWTVWVGTPPAAPPARTALGACSRWP